jgi:hypothetical protein
VSRATGSGIFECRADDRPDETAGEDRGQLALVKVGHCAPAALGYPEFRAMRLASNRGFAADGLYQ